ncbi:MAG: electron transfer flavoprotein subunit alpha/FixB family protein [Euryarchaeota archaeon]|jgi:electron transfer flavoprotein alpha subunit|nr:electron transfer flavoprotein subunit alpha/FixB family protein [Euryarchaeota archaeon]MBT3653731.1 electron transfer flavoprotein subunit alpha/FixB family protein [Euryarchaeota archaeon]MBT3757794.1 electron transfer flavoprotein subunit alpha/FixB family protein [Euryarchaeota archaeon]MBT4051132.1 electron transfer flavoprotein subunit alpha/FixB family protein [Euryarchaeota archaeon]MBT4347007.1 electron transfer flavoprotein subunit alpha/FixB family protein [Euryarchaeota archaeon
MTFTIIAESAGDSLHPTTAQLVGAASSLGNGSTVICPGGIGAAEAATIAGVEKVISVVGDCFSTFDGGAWASAINSVCNGVILASASPIGREVAARIAAKRGIPIVQDATELADGITITRPIYSGKAVETSTVAGDCVITLRPNAFEAAEEGASAPVNIVDQSADVTIAVKEAIAKASERLDVAEADIIISGGRGIGSIENFSHLEEVADIIGAAVGASRAVVDEWGMPHSMQVGQTGKTVTPSLYIAVGISGAIQHIAGMRSSKFILAINKDPDAPIFGVADYGIVANWEEAIPALKIALAAL